VEVDSETAKSDKDAVASTPPVVAENTKEPVADKAIEPTKIVESDNASYLLQAGSFESNADAENLKARIALSGEPARVEEAQVDGKTMYRVRLGPYENTQAASAAQSALASQGINANRIKIK
jgi:cell division protein FtsN